MANKDKIRRQRKLEKIAAKEGVKCFNSFYKFFVTFWPEMSGDKLIDAPHIKYICDFVQEKAMKVIRGEHCMETLIINVPPRSSKSTIVTIAFPMWVWLRAPHLASTNVSYSSTLSARHAKKARAITDSKKWSLMFDQLFIHEYGKVFKITTQNKTSIENNFKGERFNTSVEGSITGMHADFVLKDDMQNPQEAKSDTMRTSANEWDEETLTSRHKNPQSFLDIIIAQRLHEEDLTGYTLNKNITITQLQLPAEITNAAPVIPKEAESLYADGILDPLTRPKHVLEATKAQMGSSAYTCQYLQAPFNLEEQDITPSMFEIIHSVRDDIIWDLWIDGAYTEKTENDPTGIDVFSKVGNDIIWKDSYDVRKKLPDLLKFIKELEADGVFDKDRSRIFIEPKASGHSLADYIEFETEYNFVRIGEHSKQEKKLVAGGHNARHQVIKPKAESHRIKMLKGSWNDSAIVQVCGFPKAAHDEHVDTLGYAINHYYFAESTFIKPYALSALEKNATGYINISLTSSIQGYNISTTYEDDDSGDIMLFDYPNHLYKYRYICVAVLRGEGDRGGNTSITVLDRMSLSVVAMYESDSISPKKAGKKALEMAHMYSNAKLVFAVQKEKGQTDREEYDFSHIAIKEAREHRYDFMYSRLTTTDIKQRRQREYGFLVDQSTSRDIYYNLRDLVEGNKIKELPLEVVEEMKLLERKKEDGSISAREGYICNSILAYSIGAKVHVELHDDVKVRKSERW